MRSRLVRWTLLAIVLVLTLMGSSTARMAMAAQGPPDPDHVVYLQYGNIDTRVGEPELPPSLRIQASPPDTDGYYIVQFTGVILPEWKANLQATGAEPLGYVPNNAFIARMTNAERALVASLQEVQWIGIYQPAYRVAPWLPPEDEGKANLAVLTFHGADLGSIVAQLESWGGEISARIENEFNGTVLLSIDLGYVPQIARLNGVMWVEPWVEPQLTNDVARGIMDVEDAVWNTHGLYGSGQTVAIADTGLDIGLDDASMSDDFEKRIVSAHCRGRDNPCDWSDPNGHGTHVAGSALGNGRNSGSDPATRNYDSSYAGIAPEASLVFQSTMASDGSLGGLPADLNDLFQQAYEDGARIHTNSWGAPLAGAYNSYARNADQFVWTHPDMIVLFSAGNEGVDADGDGVVDLHSVSAPGTAKNVITIGATENLRPTGGYTGRWGDGWPTDYPNNPIHDDLVSDDSNGMAAFSSRGPVDGGRIKPDLVAPGTNILSARTHQHTMNMTAESGTGGWTADAPWVITTTQAYGGAHSWGTGSYTNSQSVSLTSPAMDIRTGASTIAFWTRYDLGTGDVGYTEYYSGTEWIQCGTRDAQSNPVTVAGTKSDWSFLYCGLPTSRMTDAAKQHFRIRFRLESDDTNRGTGWSVDNIQVTPQGWGFDYQAGVPNEHYMYMGGTSMATPLVAGTAALVREHYIGRGHVPSAALVRATLVNGATNIAPGQYGTGATQEIPDVPPSDVAGWGRVNLQESLFPEAPQIIAYEDVPNTDGLSTNEQHVFRYKLPGQTARFRATLVWTDHYAVPAAGSGHINNDLDLLVQMPNGGLLHPNGGTGRDSSNNTEDVFLEAANVIAGTYVITVTGHSVPEGPQGYALVVRADLSEPVYKGLEWLRDHQNSDGSWLNDVGVTSLAALAFLNHGYDESDPDVQKAIQYILSNVHADGPIYSDYYRRNYHTSLAVLPLKATQNSDYSDEIEAARDWLVSSQWDDDCLWGSVSEDNWYWGGFGYGRHTRPDLSNSQFALLALHAADLPKSHPTWSKALTFVSRCQNRQASNDGFSPHNDGGFIYHPGSTLSPDATSYGSITGAGIWGLALAGRTPSDPRFDAALDWVTDNYTWDYNPLTDGSWGDRSLYYYYMSMSKGLSMARKTKIGGLLGIGAHDWYKELSDKLASLQRADGSWANSNSWLTENRPELATSYALLALQTRQLPKDADLELVIILHSPADLHLYDADGRHVGKDYGTGGVDLEIPGSSYSADDPQTISIHPPVAGNYHLELVGTGEGDWEVEIIGLQDGVQVSYDSYTGSITPGTVLAAGLNVGAFEGSLTIFSSEPEVAPLLEVSPTSLLMIGEPGETLRSSFVISETQGNQAVEDISVFASDLTGAEGVIAAADIGLEPAAVASLPAGTSQAISVTVPLGVGLPGGTYSGTIVVESINAGAKGIDLSVGIPTPTTVDVTASPGQIAPGGENSTMTAEVRDQWGNPIRDGTVVSFTTSLGTIAPATDTTVGGVASSVLTSGDTEGTATVTAVAESADGTAAVAFGLPVGGATFFHVWTSLLVPWVGLVALAGLMLMGTIVAIRKRKS